MNGNSMLSIIIY